MSEEQKRQIDQLEAAKIDMKLDYDSQLFNLQRTYSQEQAKTEELRLRQLEQQLEKLAREREDLAGRYRQDSHHSIEQFKTLTDSLTKHEERLRTLTDRSQALEKENASLRTQLSKA